MQNLKRNKGITLIALIITIIILLILAGISIVGLTNSGLFDKSEMAKKEYEKAEIKEEIEMAILEIQTDCISEKIEFTMDELKSRLPNKLENIEVENNDDELIGQYRGYNYIITRNYEVILGTPVRILLETNTEDIGVTEVVITVKATVENGNIKLIIKPNGERVEDTGETTYTVDKNGTYVFEVITDGGISTKKSITINNIKPINPKIEVIGEYPTLTIDGIKNYDKKVSIKYDTSDQVTNYYSVDGGATWNIYENEFEPTTTNILAKTVWNDREDIYSESSKDISTVQNIGETAYDDDENTYFKCSVIGTYSYYIQVDESMINKYVRIKQFVWNNANHTTTMQFLDSDKNSLYRYTVNKNSDVNHLIPEDTVWIKFSGYELNGDPDQAWRLYDIRPIIQTPVINLKTTYPKLSTTGMTTGNQKITITYDDECIQRLYKIGEDGEWKQYNDEIIDLGNENIYEKGIGEHNVGTLVASINGTQENLKIITENAFDDDDTTYFKCSITGNYSYYMQVDESMINKYVRIKQFVWNNANHTTKMQFLDSDENSLYSYTVNKNSDVNHLIPENTAWIKFSGYELNGKTGEAWSLYTIEPVD